MLITENIGETFIPTLLETPKEMTKRYLDCLESKKLMPINQRIRFEREHIPKFLPKNFDIDERKDFIKKILYKWKHGNGQMSGLMWAYMNLHKIHVRAGGGETMPNFRNYDNKTFSLYDSCLYGKNNGKGVVAVGKRGEGKSAKIGSMGLSVISTNPSTNVLLTSKDEVAGQKLLLEKVKFPYYRLNEYLRHPAKLDNRDELLLGTGKGGGINSQCLVRAPVPEALEGQGARLWVHDEAGKTKDLLAFIENSLPLLNGEDGFTRVGFPLVIGVAGDFDKYGTDYIELWDKAQSYDFLRWFIPGWAGMFLDEFGNEDIEQAVERIFAARIEKFKASESTGAGELQRFPLTPEECFQSSATGVLPKKKIIIQQKVLMSNPVDIKTGDMIWATEGESSIFMPNDKGKIKILEHPIEKKKNAYVSFIDAYDIQEKRATGSKGAIVIFKREVKMPLFDKESILSELAEETDFKKRLQLRLKLGYIPVAIYMDDIDDPRTFGEHAMRLSVYYKAMCLCEKLPSQIFVYLKDRYPKWLQWKPVKPEVRVLKKEHYVEKGIKIDEIWKSYRTSALQSYYEDYCDFIYFMELLVDGLEYDPSIQTKKKDSIDAFGGALLHDKQPFLKEEKHNEEEKVRKLIFGYIASNGGIKTNA